MSHDVPYELATEAISHLKDLTAADLAAKPQLGTPAWRTIPTTYVVCTDDQDLSHPPYNAPWRHTRYAWSS